MTSPVTHIADVAVNNAVTAEPAVADHMACSALRRHPASSCTALQWFYSRSCRNSFTKAPASKGHSREDASGFACLRAAVSARPAE
ncbi:hypothetical protein [Actinoplanes sp. CA-252034]|uniref:hypothetical protein n=1 Tax=Actinoplanes sp. CA-252034 TaxID=3239906 RepID=UPI003D96B98F